MPTCKLCLADGCVSVPSGRGRTFLHCPACGLIFVPEAEWISPEAERARYDSHNNTVENAGYAKFLGEVVTQVAALSPKPARILDFGCGENAVMTGLLTSAGFSCAGYDPVYADRVDRSGSYDLVILCEVIEHLRDLRGECQRLKEFLGDGSRVLIRTRLYPTPEGICNWWYSRDKTHINFLAERTFVTVAGLVGKPPVAKLADDMFLLG